MPNSVLSKIINDCLELNIDIDLGVAVQYVLFSTPGKAALQCAAFFFFYRSNWLPSEPPISLFLPL